MPVAVLEPGQTLLSGGSLDQTTRITWPFSLEKPDQTTTRLISRWRFYYRPGLATRVGYGFLLQPTACVMQRKMLPGIRRRAEGTK